jgi:hypothetical protein
MPVCAACSRPVRDWRASVNAPRSNPNSSTSIRVAGIAAQLRSTNGPPDRGPTSWMMRASRPLPVPVSP